MWDSSETHLSLTPSKAFGARDGSAKETKLMPVFSRYESYEDKIREVYRPKGAIGIHHDGERIREVWALRVVVRRFIEGYLLYIICYV